jgi:hypothetical protein
MNTKDMLRIASNGGGEKNAGAALRLLLLALMLVTAIAASDAQHLLITDSTKISGSGTIKLMGNLIDSAHAAKTITGILNLDGTVAESLGTGNASGITLDSLVMAGSSAQLSQSITTDSLALTSGTFIVNGKTLTLAGGTSHSGGTLSANGAGADAVVYNRASGVQSLIDATYKSVTLSGGAAKNLLGTDSAGTVTHSGGNLTVNNNFVVTGSGAFDTVSNVTGTSTLLFTGSGTNSIVGVDTVSAGNAITNNATTALGITVLNGNSGTITAGNGDIDFTTATNGSGVITTSTKNLVFATLSGNTGTIKTTGSGAINVTGNVSSNTGSITGNSGTGAITFSGTVSNTGAGQIVSGSGGISFNGAPTNSGTINGKTGGTVAFATAVNNTGGKLVLNDSAKMVFNANFASGQTGTFSFDTATTVTFQGAANSVPAATYGNLTLNAPALSTAGNDTLAGALALTSSKLTVPAGDTLLMTSATGNNVTSTADTGEVIGAVKRAPKGNIVAGTFYAFNNDSVGLALKHASTSQLAINMQPDSGFANVPSSRYAKRNYAISGAGSLDTLSALALIYADNELVNVTNPAKLGAKSLDGPSWSKVSAGVGVAYNRRVDTTAHVVYLSSLASPLSGVSDLGISTVAYQTIKDNAQWATASTWDENAVPDSTQDVEIYNIGITIGGSGLQSASSLTLYNNATTSVPSALTIDNNLKVLGLVDVNATGSTLTVNPGLTLTIQSTGTSLRANGKVVNNGIIDIR